VGADVASSVDHLHGGGAKTLHMVRGSLSGGCRCCRVLSLFSACPWDDDASGRDVAAEVAAVFDPPVELLSGRRTAAKRIRLSPAASTSVARTSNSLPAERFVLTATGAPRARSKERVDSDRRSSKAWFSGSDVAAAAVVASPVGPDRDRKHYVAHLAAV
jgi:hypothetical protein